MDLKEYFEKAPLPQLIRWWHGEELPEWSTLTHLFLEKTLTAISNVGDEGLEFLRGQVESDDLRRRYLVLRELAHPKTADEKIVRCLLDAFNNPPSNDSRIADGFKALALDCFVTIKQYPLKRSEVEILLDGGEKWLAAAAMVYLSHAFEDESVEILSAALESSDPIMRGHACTEAGFRNIEPLEGMVVNLLKDSDEYVARSAQIGCEMFDLARFKRSVI